MSRSKKSGDGFSAAVSELESISVELSQSIRDAFPEHYEKDQYNSDPECFIHEMVALFIWRLMADTSIPHDGDYEDGMRVWLRRLGSKVNPDNSYPSVWCTFYIPGHAILFELEKNGKPSDRSHPFSEVFEIDDGPGHRFKCKLDEASDLQIAAYKADSKNGNRRLTSKVSRALSKITTEFFILNSECTEIKKTRAMEAVKRGLGDSPPSLLLQLDSLGPRDLKDVLDELHSLIGLKSVKAEVEKIIRFQKVQRLREENDLKLPNISRHLIFTGNAGTGKTTVARVLAEAYAAIGILNDGHVIETDRSGLVAGYVGQTALKTKMVCEKALGGVLFIDEAYSLNVSKSENDFGNEAIDCLLKFMEDHRNNFTVIAAGYPKGMEQLLASNPGLKSRFGRRIHFADYSVEEMYSIFAGMCQSADYDLEPSCRNILVEIFGHWVTNADESFGNAREVRTLFEKTIEYQAIRISDSDAAECSLAVLKTIFSQDIVKAGVNI